MNHLTPAERILVGLGVTDPKDIDIEAIAWTRGAVVRFRRLEKCEAMIVSSQRRAIITVNESSLPVRQRFSIAHELGHWYHHRGRILFCGAREIGNPANSALNPEHQADEFASDLILPGFLFHPRVAKLKRVTLAFARELAGEFQASLTATLLKLVKSNSFPILVVCHGKLRRRWFRRALVVSDWWFPREELDPDSFAFEMLFAGAAESSFRARSAQPHGSTLETPTGTKSTSSHSYCPTRKR